MMYISIKKEFLKYLIEACKIMAVELVSYKPSVEGTLFCTIDSEPEFLFYLGRMFQKMIDESEKFKE